jgi:hypothetical protein
MYRYLSGIFLFNVVISWLSENVLQKYCIFKQLEYITLATIPLKPIILNWAEVAHLEFCCDGINVGAD